MTCPKCGGSSNAWYLCKRCDREDTEQKIKEWEERDRKWREEVKARDGKCISCKTTPTMATDGLCRSCARARGINYG